MKPIILFGTGKIAEVLLYFWRNHSEREVIACTVDAEYVPTTSVWNGLTVIPFDKVRTTYPPEMHDMFIALGYQDMNALRARKCAEARALGYQLPSYVHPLSGLPLDCEMGDNCFIMNQTLIHPRVQLGNNVFVWSGAMIGHHCKIGDNCWLTSCCNISGVVTVGDNCFFAVNSTVGHGINIGSNCFIGANALVTKSTENETVFAAESTKVFRLDSQQFLRMSNFGQL